MFACHCRSVTSTLLLLLLVSNTMAAGAADTVQELGPSQDIAFISRQDGTEQRYVVRLPVDFNPDRPHRLLVALHGHGSDRWQFVTQPRDECRAARDAAAQHGMIYVSPDYRATTSWMGPAAESDMLQILDDLQGRYRIEQVILCGGSMGATSALAFAALHPDLVDGVVAMNGTANLVEYEGFVEAIATSYGGTKADQPDLYHKRSAELFPERMTMPLGLTTGGRDTLVPAASVLRLANVLKQREASVLLIHRPEGGHETNYADARQAFEFVIAKSRPNDSSAKPLLTFGDQPRTIVCLGDSVTGVYYHTGGVRAYPEMLELGLHQLFPHAPLKVINAGISGHTTQEGLERLERDVLCHHPDLVTISFGLNDLVRVAPEQFRANLELLVKRCREQNSQVVLCTPNAVIDTAARPVDKLNTYCETIRTVARELSVPLCDQYRVGTQLRRRAPWTWRLTLSDEIHPNMDGHKRMAEELCRVIANQSLSLESAGPPRPSLSHVKSLLQKQQVIRVLAMPPYDELTGPALKKLSPDAKVEVTTWNTAGKSIATLEQEAKTLVRPLKPDLVVLAVPRDATAETDEQFVHGYSWIMNWSLSFGHQEWDCLVVHPSVAVPEVNGSRDDLGRRLVWAQHLDLIDRSPTERSKGEDLFSSGLNDRLKD